METELFNNVMLVDDHEQAKFELLRLEAEIFDKRSIVTVDSSSDYSEYSKASSSRPPSGSSIHSSSSKSKHLATASENSRSLVRTCRKETDEKITKSSAPTKSIKRVGGKGDDKNKDQCNYCNKKGFLICCDFCEAAFHVECHTPPLESVPTGSFECYQCYYRRFYEKNPVQSSKNVNIGYSTACFIKELETMQIVPFSLPEHVNAFIKDVPSIMPNKEFKRKFKRKKDVPSDCYVCDRPVSFRNSNQCQFCTNTIHLDCDPQPSCSTRLYAWRCALHVENYLDTYMLDSTSTHKRIKLWAEHKDSNLDQLQTERAFFKRLVVNSNKIQTLEVAQTMLDLKNSSTAMSSNTTSSSQQPSALSISPYNQTSFNNSTLYSDVFITNPKAIAAFFMPAFETGCIQQESSEPIKPVIYDGRPLSIGTSASCTFNLSSLPFKCKAMSSKQLILQRKQELHYLCAGIGGFTRVDKVLLAERPPRFPADLCPCIEQESKDEGSDRNPPMTCSRIAVFPHKMYKVQLGCAHFYLLFRPVANQF
ncbi:PHD finger protein 12 [Aphelenchoides bicaudatus]|nr:PHD finger protein 12 [Aphelenchoides bicaudatus]